MSNTSMGYKRVIGATRSSCSNGLRGFKLNIKKLSIHKLRVKFLHLFRVLKKWKKSYERAIRSLRKGLTYRRRSSTSNKNNKYSLCYNINSSSKSRLIGEKDVKSTECRLRSLARTNSFYTEAIADCLEFIKRNSLSVDDPNDEAAPIAAALR